MQARHWCYTDNNPDTLFDWSDIPDCRYAIYQEEVGENGNYHHQGYVEFNRPKRLAALKKILAGAHWEPRRGTRESAREYCSKSASQVGGPYEYGVFEVDQGVREDLNGAKSIIQNHKRWRDVVNDDELVPILSKYSKWSKMVFDHRPLPPAKYDIVLRPWQQEAEALLKDAPVKRRIIWIWSDSSSSGKTTFMQYIGTKMDLLPGVWTLADLIYAYDGHDVIHFNIPRHEDVNETQWKVLETLSDQGKVFSKKYESTVKEVCAHIVVTSNQTPFKAKQKLPDRILEIHVPEQDGVAYELLQ